MGFHQSSRAMTSQLMFGSCSPAPRMFDVPCRNRDHAGHRPAALGEENFLAFRDALENFRQVGFGFGDVVGVHCLIMTK